MAAAEEEARLVGPLMGAEDDAVARIEASRELGFPGADRGADHGRDRDAVAAGADHAAVGVPRPAEIGGELWIAVGEVAHRLEEVGRLTARGVGRAGDRAGAIPGIDRREQVQEIVKVDAVVAVDAVGGGHLVGKRAHETARDLAVAVHLIARAILDPGPLGRHEGALLVGEEVAHGVGPCLVHRMIGNERRQVAAVTEPRDAHVGIAVVRPVARARHVGVSEQVAKQGEPAAEQPPLLGQEFGVGESRLGRGHGAAEVSERLVMVDRDRADDVLDALLEASAGARCNRRQVALWGLRQPLGRREDPWILHA